MEFLSVHSVSFISNFFFLSSSLWPANLSIAAAQRVDQFRYPVIISSHLFPAVRQALQMLLLQSHGGSARRVSIVHSCLLWWTCKPPPSNEQCDIRGNKNHHQRHQTETFPLHFIRDHLPVPSTAAASLPRDTSNRNDGKI